MTDCENVARGWRCRIYDHLEGADADVWAQIGMVLKSKPAHLLIVFSGNSHLGAEQIVDGTAPKWMIMGNNIIDELVGEKAFEVRLSKVVKYEIVQMGRKARLIRHRLLRAVRDCLQV